MANIFLAIEKNMDVMASQYYCLRFVYLFEKKLTWRQQQQLRHR
jgi:hypothetical protein